MVPGGGYIVFILVESMNKMFEQVKGESGICHVDIVILKYLRGGLGNPYANSVIVKNLKGGILK